MFGLGTTELIVLLLIGGVVFFFGKGKVMEWLNLGKEIKATANKNEA